MPNGQDEGNEGGSPMPTVTARPLAASRVDDIMTTGLISCTPETPLRRVAAIMAERHVHSVYVFDYGLEDDETAELWGLVSDLDLVAAGRDDLDSRTARDSAVTPLVCVRPVGVLSTLDLARVLAD
jgi:CBS domain-containing protein